MYKTYLSQLTKGLPRWLSGEESACQCRRGEFDPWVGKIPQRRKWQPTPVFLPGKSHGQRRLTGLGSVGSQRVRQDWATKHACNPESPSEGQLILRTLFGSNMSGKWAISWSRTWGSPGLLLTHVVILSCSSEIKANTLSWGILLPLLFGSANTSVSHVLSSNEATLAEASDFDRISSL